MKTDWPPLDPDIPPTIRARMVDDRLSHLHRRIQEMHVFDQQEVSDLLWVIDLARGLRLLKTGTAWGLAILAALAALVSQWDTLMGVFRR